MGDPTNNSYPYTQPRPQHLVRGALRAKIRGGERGREASATYQVFANSTTGFYDDVGEAGANNGFNLSHFSPS